MTLEGKSVVRKSISLFRYCRVPNPDVALIYLDTLPYLSMGYVAGWFLPRGITGMLAVFAVSVLLTGVWWMALTAYGLDNGPVWTSDQTS